jgi:hypothetical protein
MHLDLTDDEAAALIKELADITGNDRYPFSSRIQTLRAILAKLKLEPAHEPLPPPKVYAPPRADRAGRHRAGHWLERHPRCAPMSLDATEAATGEHKPEAIFRKARSMPLEPK